MSLSSEQRQDLIHLLEADEEISPEWARVLFPPEKREYELVYHGKDREEDIIADTLAVPLQPVRTFGKNGDEWHNMLIFGDNLQVMKTLLEVKKDGKLCNADGTLGVRLIFIDPPFSTRQEFRGTEDQKAYQDKIAGAQFLEFLRKRLVFMRELLTEDGSIVVHLDLRKSHHIKLLLDEIFSEARIINEIIWHYENKLGTGGDKLDGRHDTLLWYGRGRGHVFNPINLPVKEKKLQPVTQKINGERVWLRDENGKRRYQESRDTRPVGDIWTIPIINPVASERLGYPTQKPEALAESVLNLASNTGDIVMDAFVGSGTTLAVAEKLNRRWIGIDCGKLAIYTIQKRMLNLRREIGNKGPKLEPKPFTLYNAGLYDFSKLRELPWQDWRFFALQLFQCRDERHKIGGIELDGYRQGASVMVFNHMEAKHKDARITEDTIQEIHEAVGSRVGNKVFIIAPALTFDFQQDYIDFDKVRYYALRIPYSIIHELHRREFTALKQPSDEMAVNDTVEAVGFDFIRTPELKYRTGTEKAQGELFEYGFIKIETFKSDAVVREPFKKKGNLETLSMVMFDFDYDEGTKVFDLDEVHYADDIEKDGWKVSFLKDRIGKKMMVVFLDIYGNEARVLIGAVEFGKGAGKDAPKKNRKKK
jgi:site-specific DNA-methyltransferase (adenine-specific)/adenine-specific DNA-methyltransferase